MADDKGGAEDEGGDAVCWIDRVCDVCGGFVEDAVGHDCSVRLGTAVAVGPLARVRALCLALPETTERLSHGSPTFFVRDKKTFVMYMDDHHGDGRLALWCAAPPGAQAAMVDEEPERFFRPPYVGHRGWVGVRLDRDVAWDEIARIVEDSYRCVAPKTSVAKLRPAGSAGGQA